MTFTKLWQWASASLLLLGLMSTAQAAPLATEQLKAFSNVKTFQADFSQVQSLSDGKTERSSGRLSLSQPGKFRWEYKAPHPQLIVSDGQKVWFYDPDLDQVIVRSQSKAIGDKPALLLSNPKAAEVHFNIRNLDTNEDQLSWLEATPKDKDSSSFASIRIGFSNNQPMKLILTDLFGKQSVFTFSGMKTGLRLDSKAFSFTPPAGVDVLTD